MGGRINSPRRKIVYDIYWGVFVKTHALSLYLVCFRYISGVFVKNPSLFLYKPFYFYFYFCFLSQKYLWIWTSKPCIDLYMCVVKHQIFMSFTHRSWENYTNSGGSEWKTKLFPSSFFLRPSCPFPCPKFNSYFRTPYNKLQWHPILGK